MSRSFSMPTFLRMVPNSLLKEFFERQGLGDLDIPWSKLSKRDVEGAVRVIQTLEPARLEAVEAACQSVFALACDPGTEALVEAAAMLGDSRFSQDLPAHSGPYCKSMWAF